MFRKKVLKHATFLCLYWRIGSNANHHLHRRDEKILKFGINQCCATLTVAISICNWWCLELSTHCVWQLHSLYIWLVKSEDVNKKYECKKMESVDKSSIMLLQQTAAMVVSCMLCLINSHHWEISLHYTWAIPALLQKFF